MNRIAHFEIHASVIERAVKFYQTVFGWEIKKWESPDMEYWMVMTGKDPKDAKYHGIDGGMIIRKGESPQSGAPVNAFVCTIIVKNIDDSLKKVVAYGGSIAVPKMALAGMAWQAYCTDTEGNLFGVHQIDPQAK